MRTVRTPHPCGRSPKSRHVEKLESQSTSTIFVKLAQQGADVHDECSGALREAFGMYEMEGEGCIMPTSLKRMLSRLGSEQGVDDCHAMICRFDLDGDDVLSFHEFKIMMSA